jgi:Cd2+/Zn2+-exporting ATPase
MVSMATRVIKIPTNCPPTSGERERCAQSLREQLLATSGISDVKLECNNGDGQASIELRYDPRLISLNELNAEVRRAGACISPNRASLVLGIDGMVSPRTEQAIEAHLAKLPGVVASANFASRSVRVEFDRSQCAMPEIARRLDELGLRIRSGGAAPRGTGRVSGRDPMTWLSKFFAENPEMATAVAGAFFLMGAWSVKFFQGPPALRYVLVALSFVIAGWYTAIDTFKILLKFKFDIDVLMFAAALGAAAIGNYEEGAFLLVLFAFGGAGEDLAMERARRAIEALSKLAPDTATVRDTNGRERLVKVEDLSAGDLVVVRPFDRLPADGTVDAGASAVDQSPITGESIPVEKVAGSMVYAGTINGEGLLTVTVTRLTSESTLAKIVKMVQEAQTTKSPTQVFTDKVERFYVPFVLIMTTLLIIVPPLLGLHHRQAKGEWAGWFYQAMAFLTAASPCALAIGTPAAILSGIARAARIGVLVKGGVHLENLGRIRVIAFDKTGTLTQGRAEVTDVIALDSLSSDEVLSLAASVEQTSSHPLARAICDEARAREIKCTEAIDAQQIPGLGVSAVVDGRHITAGRSEMFAQQNGLGDAIARLGETGKSIVIIGVDGKPVGVIGMADRPRANAADALARLKRLGIRRNIMLTGDKTSVAAAMSKTVGADEYHAELLPQNKLELVRDLQKKYGPLAMVGDGVNDAPALATATVGIAMGGAGTDVAIETADVALMSDDLAKLPDAIALSRFSRKIIKQNLAIALGVISVLAPLSALGFTYLGIAVLFHEGSTVVVVLNSLRLLVFKSKK